MKKIIFILLLLLSFSLNAEILEDFDDPTFEIQDLKKFYNVDFNSNAAGSIEQVNGYQNKSLKYSVKFNDGTYTYITLPFDHINISDGDLLRFFYKYSGIPINLYFNLNDTEILIKKINPTTSWESCIIDLDLFPDVNLSQIEKIKFVIKKASTGACSGSLIINRLDLYRSEAVSEQTLWIDRYEGAEEDFTNEINYQFAWIYPNTNVNINTHRLWTTSPSNPYLTLLYTNGINCTEVKWQTVLDGTIYTNLTPYDSFVFDIKCNKPEVNLAATLQYSGLFWNINSTKNDFYNKWETIDFPLSKFADKDLKSVDEIQLVFYLPGVAENTADNFTVNLDNFKLLRKQKDAGFIRTIDKLDYYNNSSSWTPFIHEKNTMTISTADGLYNSKAIKIDFTFVDGDYLVLEKMMYLNLTKKYLQFQLLTEGDNNTFEVKILDKTDNDGVYVTHARTFPQIIGKLSKWTTIKIYPEDWKYWGSSDADKRKNFNLKQVEKLSFVLIQNNSGQNAVVYLDNIEILSETEHSFKNNGNNLIKYLKIDNMSFSPNNDGDNDDANFIFQLLEPAKINIYVFNLKGELLKTIYPYNDGLPYNTDEHTIKWNGQDNDNHSLKNGVYIFKFIAKNDAKSEVIKNIIAIVK